MTSPQKETLYFSGAFLLQEFWKFNKNTLIWRSTTMWDVKVILLNCFPYTRGKAQVFMGRRHRIAQRGTVVLSLCQSVFKLSVLVSGNILPILTFLIRELQQMSGLFLQSWGAGYRGGSLQCCSWSLRSPAPCLIPTSWPPHLSLGLPTAAKGQDFMAAQVPDEGFSLASNPPVLQLGVLQFNSVLTLTTQS